ncbi:MAG: lipoprotein signal peptidase [Solirubrobacteraceae bacterium]
MKKISLLLLILLIIDQLSKYYIKTNFQLFESREIFGWFKLTFVENLGMAYGISYGEENGKSILTIVRLIMICFIGVWIYNSVKKNASNYFLIPITLIFAGAVGNLVDSIFYGVCFDKGTTFNSHYYEGLASLNFNGYSTLLQGAVVDMLEFPLFSFVFPDWFPYLKGTKFDFFKYIFNLADSYISIGVFFLIVFNKKAFSK